MKEEVIIIAKYMGWTHDHGDWWFNRAGSSMHICYWESIDNLTDVWETLGLNVNLSYQPAKDKYRCRVWKFSKDNIYKETKPPIQYESAIEASVRAAAIAIKAIK